MIIAGSSDSSISLRADSYTRYQGRRDESTLAPVRANYYSASRTGQGIDDLYEHSEATDGVSAIELTPHGRGEVPVNPLLYGKFAEHLAWNVSHGMTAQLLYSPTFERWWFRSTSATSDGGFAESTDPERRDAMAEEHASQRDYPGAGGLKTAVTDGLSF